MRQLLFLLLLSVGCAPSTVHRQTDEELTAACREEYRERWLIDGYASITDVVELGALRVETGGSSVSVETTVAELRAAFGRPDSLRVREYVSFDPEAHPDWVGASPTWWLYPSVTFVVLPDSSAVLTDLDVSGGAALFGDGLRLDARSRRTDLAARYPKSWRCREGHPHNALAVYEAPEAEALTVIDTTATPGRSYRLGKATLVFEDGRLTRVFR